MRRVSGGGFTGQLFGEAGSGPALAQGALLKIEGPVGQFIYRAGQRAGADDRRRHRLRAAEVDAAPRAGDRHPRDIHLYWGARHARDLYEEALVLEWVQRYPQLRFTAVLSEAPAAEAAHQRTGFVHEAVLADHPILAGMQVYAAGPPAMIEAIRATFPGRGLPPDQLYFDSFDYAPDSLRRQAL